MRKFTFLFAALTLAALFFGAQSIEAASGAKKKANKDTAAWRYEIEYAKTGGNNMLMVKVWSYAKKAATAIEQGKKNAVHGVIFKGYTSTESGTVSQRALVREPDAANQHRDFFDEFFADGGPYLKYVSAVADGSTETRKVGKEYKVGIVVTVNKDALRSDLEKAGIIKALGAGF
jgi:predicted outer membrane protein